MYFVTICTKDRVHYFGHIVDNTMILSDIGEICDHEIQQLNNRKTVDVHEYIVMPNHVHILLYMGEFTQKINE
jgi:REP element-mobilizing transposase RayT